MISGTCTSVATGDVNDYISTQNNRSPAKSILSEDCQSSMRSEQRDGCNRPEVLKTVHPSPALDTSQKRSIMSNPQYENRYDVATSGGINRTTDDIRGNRVSVEGTGTRVYQKKTETRHESNIAHESVARTGNHLIMEAQELEARSKQPLPQGMVEVSNNGHLRPVAVASLPPGLSGGFGIQLAQDKPPPGPSGQGQPIVNLQVNATPMIESAQWQLIQQLLVCVNQSQNQNQNIPYNHQDHGDQPHTWQWRQYNQISTNMPEGHVVFCRDFAENYACRSQDEAQGAHWSNIQAKIHPVVASYRCNKDGCEECVTDSMMMISNDQKHCPHAV